MIGRHINKNLAPFFIRLGIGSIMLVQHGLPKLTNFSNSKSSFPDPLGVSSEISLFLTIFAEVFCSVFIIIGLKTRLSSIPLIITMAVAAFIVHAGDPWAKQELAVIYLIVFVSLLLSGGGKYSIKE